MIVRPLLVLIPFGLAYAAILVLIYRRSLCRLEVANMRTFGRFGYFALTAFIFYAFLLRSNALPAKLLSLGASATPQMRSRVAILSRIIACLVCALAGIVAFFLTDYGQELIARLTRKPGEATLKIVGPRTSVEVEDEDDDDNRNQAEVDTVIASNVSREAGASEKGEEQRGDQSGADTKTV